MNKLCIIPFTREEFPLLSSAKKKYSITSLVTPPGFGVADQDVSVIRNCSPVGYFFPIQFLTALVPLILY